jgi:hypothetical protein
VRLTPSSYGQQQPRLNGGVSFGVIMQYARAVLLFGRCELRRCASCFAYSRHHFIRGSLLYYVAVPTEPMEPALSNVGVQPGRLAVNVD